MPKVFSSFHCQKGWRTASHSGSWYDDDPTELAEQIVAWLDGTEQHEDAMGRTGHCRAVIAPHAGYSYCGHVMAYAYRHMDPVKIKRIFILGPSHHFYSRRCHISPATHYSTPMGPIQIDEDVYRQLDASGHFHLMTKAEDEAEHSLELHLPYIVHRMKGQQFTIVPIVVGALSAKEEATYGALLASYFQDPDNFFVISSDFCHWGARFSYTFWEREHGEIYESIENLDRQGMKIIEQVDPEAFSTYLSKTQNTICGRHPIGVFLNLLTHNKDRRPQITFTKYDQSSRCKSLRDSSVSYAAAVVTVSEENLEMEEDVGSAIA